jgi:hypothetical protein
MLCGSIGEILMGAIDSEELLKWKEYNRVKRRRSTLHRYGITPEVYQRMFDDQGGCCKICARPSIEFKKGLAVDHCHRSGSVRALLCPNCNMMLGNAKENIETLRSAISYLEENK